MTPTKAMQHQQNRHLYDAIFSSPVGLIGIVLHNNHLAELDFIADNQARDLRESDLNSNEKISVLKIEKEIKQYFINPSHQFTVPLHIKGTSFQQRVWQALQAIPAGKTLTYGMLAKQLNTGPRAIGQACRTNHIPLFIPCHRIVATNHIGGFVGNINGPFAKIKEKLLLHEQS